MPQQEEVLIEKTAAEACRHVKLSEEAMFLLRPAMKADDFVSQLVDKDYFVDAIKLIPHLLPIRSAVWWGATCVWSVFRPRAPQAEAKLLKLVMQWLQEPEDEARRAAGSAVIPLENPRLVTATLALAVFCSGGSISVPGQPDVFPKPHDAPNAVANSVLLAATKVPPKKVKACRQHFVELAMSLLNDPLRWDTKPVVSWAAN